MNILLIKTKNGKIYQGRACIHAILMDNLGINPDDVLDVGFITRGRKVWCNRQPH